MGLSGHLEPARQVRRITPMCLIFLVAQKSSYAYQKAPGAQPWGFHFFDVTTHLPVCRLFLMQLVEKFMYRLPGAQRRYLASDDSGHLRI